MGMTARWAMSLVLAVAGIAPSMSEPGTDSDAELRAARWTELRHALFADRTVADGAAWMNIDAPARALDAALVPITMTIEGKRPIKSLYLIIDENPGPLAGHFIFGPQADPHSLKLRVRVNAYTYIHAVAETSDDQLYAVSRFVKAAGGCSAPAAGDEREALKDLGQIKLRLLRPFVPGQPMQARMMVRHPNFNGMQLDQVTRLYTPALFIRTIDVSYNDAEVMHLDSDISLSSDPVIDFGFAGYAFGGGSRRGKLRAGGGHGLGGGRLGNGLGGGLNNGLGRRLRNRQWGGVGLALKHGNGAGGQADRALFLEPMMTAHADAQRQRSNHEHLEHGCRVKRIGAYKS